MSKEIKVPVFVRKATGLTKEVGPWTAWLMPWYSIAGSGITFYALRIYYKFPMTHGMLAFAIAGIPAVLSAINIAILGVCMPRSAGGYVWATRFIDPFVGWFGAGWMYLLCYLLAVGLLTYVGPTVVGSILAIAGSAAHIPALTAAGEILSHQLWAIMIAAVFLNVLMLVINSLGLKWFIRAMWLFWVINFIGVLFSAIGYYSCTPALAKARWDATWGAGVYDAIVAVTDAHDVSGYVASVSKGFWGDTILSMTDVFWAYTAWETLAYVGGEVRTPEKSFLYYYVGGLVSCIVMYLLLSYGPLYAYGRDFLVRYNYLYELYAAGKLTAEEIAMIKMPIVTPCQPLFGASAMPVTALKIPASFWFYPCTAVLSCYLAATRAVFGMAFDRYFPEWLATVSERFHAPIGASIAVFIISLIINALIALGYKVFVAASNLSFYTAWFCLMYAWAAICMPHKRPDIWERGIKVTIFGITEAELFGLLASIALFPFLFLGVVGMSLLSIEVTSLEIAIGFIIFIYYARKNKARGISLADTFGTVPPA